MSRYGRWGLAGGLALLATACSTASYLSSTYVGILPQIVTTGCRDAYEVYDKRDAHKLLVVSHIFREVSDCGGPGRADLSAEAARRARFREAADLYLADIRRGDCRILEESALSRMHYEYVYACAGPETPARGPVPPPRS
jgi:hypothetical protein